MAAKMTAFDLIEGFRQAMREAGLEPPNIIEPGMLHRFPGIGKDKKNKAAWCRLFPDMRGGIFGDYSSGLQSSWQAGKGETWTAEQKREFAKKCAAEKEARAREDAKKRERSSAKAIGILAAATGDPAQHPYALRKSVDMGGLLKRGAWPQRGWDDALLIPIYSASGKIWTLGAINADGEKDYLAGGAKAGNFHPIGKVRGATRVYIAEGIATAAVGYALDGSPSVAAMDAGGLDPVAKIVRCLAAPGAEIIFLADDDQKDGEDKNVGIEAATNAAQAVGGRVALPGLGRKADFWDLWNELGIDAVRNAVDAAQRIDGEQDGNLPPLEFTPLTLDDIDPMPPDFEGMMHSEGGVELLIDRFGAPISCALNAQIWLEEMPRRFAKNEFTLQQCMDGKPIEDETQVGLLVEIQRSRRANLRKEHLLDGLTMACSKNKFHPVRDWFDSLEWDGTPRVAKFLHVCMGVPDSPYCRATSLSLFMSAVSRAYVPGCQVDTMLVLEGDQGAGKSSAIIALFSEEWHTEVSCDVRDKDFYQNLRGKLCVEFGEMSGISLADSSHIKDMLTKRIDTYRASYARTSSDYPRQNIFIGTTNDDAYLRDATGERRYLPVKTGKIRLDWIRIDRDQLWAEAVAYHKAKTYERWYEIPDAADEQDKRHMVDPWEEAIASALHYRESCTSTYLLSDVIGLKLQDQGQREKNRVSAILKRLGWTCKKERVEGEPLPVRLYRPKPTA